MLNTNHMMSRKSTAFTLIELLIVIGVLGILAAGLLAAVDPFEQLKKARDANNRNAVIELHNAYTRYYATHGSLPWDYSGASAGCVAALIGFNRGGVQTGQTVTTLDPCILDLEGDGELKTGFTQALGGQADKMFTASPGTTQVFVCFSPEGKGLWKDTQNKYSSNGVDISGVGEACETGGAKPAIPDSPASCYWCAK